LRPRDLGALFASALAVALQFAPALAEPLPRDPLAAALESFTAFDAALAALKPPVYHRQERTFVAERLADLKRKVDAVKLADAERSSPKAAALERLRRAVADAEERERAFWKNPPIAADAFPNETAETLRRDDASIRVAFAPIVPGFSGKQGSSGSVGPGRTRAVPPPTASGSVTRAQKSAGRSISDPNAFFDGERTGTGGVVSNRATPAANGHASLHAAAGSAAVPRARVSDLRVALVPKLQAAAPAISREQAACRQAAGGGVIAHLCSSPFPMIAPAVAGFGDAFKEQFGTAAGWASTAVSLLIGIVLPAVMGGVGILFNVLRAVCGLAVLWAIGALVSSLYSLYREFTSTSPTDPRHWRVARQFGAVCGKLLLTIVFTIAGIKIGSQPGVKGAVMSGLQSLQAKLATLGRGAAAPSAMASQIRGAFAEPKTPSPTKFVDGNRSKIEPPARPPERSLSNPDSLRGATKTDIERIIPSDWTDAPARNGLGNRYTKPGTRGAVQVRIMDGNPNAPDLLHQGPRVIISNGADSPISIPLKGNAAL
jgi:hypothetical protein